jgi:hypothetical protein
MENSPDKQNKNISQQLQFFAHWFQDLPFFSKCELPYWEFELIEAFFDLIPGSKGPRFTVTGEVLVNSLPHGILNFQ